jgi:hypothetical protein
MRKPKKGASIALEPKEWNFPAGPPAEVEACYVYEYGREFARGDQGVLKLLSDFRKVSAGKTKAERKGWLALLKELVEKFEIGFPDFPSWAFHFIPKSPWQTLSKSDRSYIVEKVRDGYSRRLEKSPLRRFHIETLRELAPANINSLRVFRFVHELGEEGDLGKTEYGFFALNWRYSDKEIRDVFAEWLSEQRTEFNRAGVANQKRPGRGGFRDRLNWLGALRIVNHYPPKQLADYPESKLKIDAPYSHLPDLYEIGK